MTRWGSACTRRAGSSRPTVFYQECVDRRVRDAARYMVRRSACSGTSRTPSPTGRYRECVQRDVEDAVPYGAVSGVRAAGG